MLNHKIVTAGVITNLNGVVGNNGKIPWGISQKEVDSLAETIKDETVVQGRKTFEMYGGWSGAKHNVTLSKSKDVFNNCLVCQSLNEATNSADSHLFVFGGSTLYKEVIPLFDEFYVSVRNESTSIGDTFLSWVDKPVSTTKEIVDGLFNYIRKHNINGKSWGVRIDSSLVSEDGVIIDRYKVYRKYDVPFVEENVVRSLFNKSVELGKTSKEVGHLMDGCSALHHQYSMFVLGANSLNSTGFGFTGKDGKHYSVKYRHDVDGSTVFSDLYVLEFFDKPIDGRMYSSTEICPFTGKVNARYETKNSFKMSSTGELLVRNYSGDNLTNNLTEFLKQCDFPSNYDIIFFGYKEYGTTVEFRVPGLSGFYNL